MTASSVAKSWVFASQWYLLLPVNRYVGKELVVVFDR